MLNTIQIVFNPDSLRFLFNGLWLTVRISVVVIILSILFGSILGLLRNYERIILGRIAGVYIEIFRNTPLLLWMFACIFIFSGSMLDLTERGGLALWLYTSAVIAEILRGGLNSIPVGQFEAARSQGFNFIQTLWYIILPQAYRRIIPSLLSQVITTIKDTAFLAGFGILELFRSGQVLLSSIPEGVDATTQLFLMYGFMALIYFVICFALSCVVRRLQHRKVRLAQKSLINAK